MPVHHIKSADEFKKFVDEDKFTIVDFTATWCGPCQMIKPIFEKLSNDEKYKNVQFLKVDVDELQDVSSDAGIEAMPTFHIYKKGEKKDELVGASEEELIDLLNKNVK